MNRANHVRKYGNSRRQLRALIILDDLIQNAGPDFQKDFADEMLLERLRFMVKDPLVDANVKAKCTALYKQWAVIYNRTPGMQNVAALYKQLPQRKKAPNKATSKVLRETERLEDDDDDEEDDGPFQARSRGPSVTGPPAVRPRGQSITGSSPSNSQSHRRHSSAKDFHTAANQMAYNPPAFITNQQAQAKKDRKSGKISKTKLFNFEKEKPQINQVITLASIEATGLLNAMKLINRENERVSENSNTLKRFETCKQLRRQTYRYCSIVMDESYLGTLLSANDQLSDALILYEQLDRGFDYDSDSEDYDDPDVAFAQAARQEATTGMNAAESTNPLHTKLRDLKFKEKSPAMPPRALPAVKTASAGNKGKYKEKSKEEDQGEDDDVDDDDDPFADRNAVNTPRIERDEPRWSVLQVIEWISY